VRNLLLASFVLAFILTSLCSCNGCAKAMAATRGYPLEGQTFEGQKGDKIERLHFRSLDADNNGKVDSYEHFMMLETVSGGSSMADGSDFAYTVADNRVSIPECFGEGSFLTIQGSSLLLSSASGSAVFKRIN
jgi:hypothetical protein